MEDTLDSREIILMRKIGRIAHIFLQKLKKIIRSGMTTKDIEEEFDRFLKKRNLKSAFLGYNGYPASLCVSVDEEVIHGIPRRDKVIKDGSLVSVDLGIEKDGLFVDCAYTYLVGKVPSLARKLFKVGIAALKEGIRQARVGNTTGDIGFAIQRVVEKSGFSVIRRFVGHGIGHKLHCYPEVPNFGTPKSGAFLKEGMVLAIEPMISSGNYEVDILEDGWTARTKDKSLSCHFEHTVVITKRGPYIVT